ncbi:MAG UNVERIFIED_CONTAM: fatty acid desaturase [Rickettsiaceae bacterium]|jgi:stearoyl-CoA desaturase (delta-9 desaturase)
METQEKLKLNPLVFVVLVAYPLFMIALGTWYIYNYGISTFEIILFVTSYYAFNISIGVGLHRCWSHGAYKLNKVVEFILAVISAGTLQGPALVWCSDHHKHHTFTDEEGDPHSPLKYKDNPLKGFLWAHIGWMLFSDGIGHVDRITMAKLGKNSILRWQMKYYWQIAVFVNAILPLILGYLFGGMTALAALSGYIFVGLARALQQQITFCINSWMHFVGNTPYAISTAKDSWWLFPFVLGENWHNFHHAFPMDYRNGVKWYHPDVHKWIIYALEKLGLATSLIRTSDVRIKAKKDETKRQLSEQIKTNLSLVEQAATFIAKASEARLAATEDLAGKAKKQIELVHAKALDLAENVRGKISQADAFQKDITAKYHRQLRKIEQIAKKLNIKLSKIQVG